MFAPSHTLLLITSRVLARVDLSGRRQLRVEKVWVQPCAEMPTPTAAAALALNLGPRRCGRIWVLSSDFWTGAISLAADVSPLLSQTELNQALALEAEIDSGISAFTSRVGAIRLSEQSPGESRWCVTQVSTADLQYMQEALTLSSRRVVGVAHPAAAHIAQAADRGSLDSDQLLIGWDDCLVPADANPEEIHAAVASWAEGWANYLVQSPTSPLVIRCDEAPLSPRQRMLASVAMGLLATCACGIWHWQTQHRTLSAARTIASLEERQAAGETAQRTLQTLEASVAKLRKDTLQAETLRRELENALFRADRTHAQQNHRWLALLDAIAGSIDNQCWIQQLESKSVQATVHGLATDNAAAHRFAGALEVGLRGSGWSVLPAETRPTEKQLVAFKIVLDASPGPVAPSDDGVASESSRLPLLPTGERSLTDLSAAVSCLGQRPARYRERL